MGHCLLPGSEMVAVDEDVQRRMKGADGQSTDESRSRDR